MDDAEDGCEAVVLLLFGIAFAAEIPKGDRRSRAFRITIGDKVLLFFTDKVGGVFDGRADEIPPQFEAGWRLRGIAACSQPWIAEQDGEERAQNLATVHLCPGDRVRVVKGPVFRIEAVDVDADIKRA